VPPSVNKPLGGIQLIKLDPSEISAKRNKLRKRDPDESSKSSEQIDTTQNKTLKKEIEQISLGNTFDDSGIEIQSSKENPTRNENQVQSKQDDSATRTKPPVPFPSDLLAAIKSKDVSQLKHVEVNQESSVKDESMEAPQDAMKKELESKVKLKQTLQRAISIDEQLKLSKLSNSSKTNHQIVDNKLLKKMQQRLQVAGERGENVNDYENKFKKEQVENPNEEDNLENPFKRQQLRQSVRPRNMSTNEKVTNIAVDSQQKNYKMDLKPVIILKDAIGIKELSKEEEDPATDPFKQFGLQKRCTKSTQEQMLEESSTSLEDCTDGKDIFLTPPSSPSQHNQRTFDFTDNNDDDEELPPPPTEDDLLYLIGSAEDVQADPNVPEVCEPSVVLEYNEPVSNNEDLTRLPPPPPPLPVKTAEISGLQTTHTSKEPAKEKDQMSDLDSMKRNISSLLEEIRKGRILKKVETDDNHRTVLGKKKGKSNSGVGYSSIEESIRDVVSSFVLNLRKDIGDSDSEDSDPEDWDEGYEGLIKN